MYTLLAILWLFLIYREDRNSDRTRAIAPSAKMRFVLAAEEESGMGTIWFWLVAIMIAMYVLLDWL